MAVADQIKIIENKGANSATEGKCKKEIYLQAQKLFSLREDIFKKLTNKRILNNDSE